MTAKNKKTSRTLFGAVASVWFVLDAAVKIVLDSFYGAGDYIAGPFAGIFELRLVHNTGAAWGVLGDSTMALGIFSIIVCAAIFIYAFNYRRGDMPLLQVASLALVFAGGLGNALNRLTMGYVVDMIAPVFIDFPVFNVADIGITCGIALFIISFAIDSFTESKHAGDGDVS